MRFGFNLDSLRALGEAGPSSILDRGTTRSLSRVDSTEDLRPCPSLLWLALLTEGVDELSSFPGRRAFVKTALKPRPDGVGEVSAGGGSI